MIDAKSVASNAKAEQELEAHNRGLREKVAAIASKPEEKEEASTSDHLPILKASDA